MKKGVYIHPIVYAVLPSIILYSHNIREAWPISLLWPVIYSLLLAFVSWLVFLLFLRKPEKASILTSVWLIIFFSYGHAFLLLAQKGFFEFLPIGPHFFLLSVSVGLVLFVYFGLLFYKKSLEIATTFFTVASVTLFLLNTLPLLPFEFKRIVALQKLETYIEQQDLSTKTYTNTDTASYPDIYYFVFDRYPNQTIAKEYFEHDTTDFTQSLEEDGFYIATQSAANYPSSYQSISSALNMTHLTFLNDLLGQDYADQTVVYKTMLDTAQVPKFLLAKGYEYHHLGSNWEPTKQSTHATKNYNLFLDFNEFESFLYENTFANAFLGKIRGESVFTGVEILKIHQENIPHKINTVKQLVTQESPKYVFGHFLLPHPPYLFDQNCAPLTFEAVRKRPDNMAYIDQVDCASKTMQEFAQAILENHRSNVQNRPVVIIFQSDEGPYLPLEYFNDTQHLTSENNDAYKIHSRILNAIYMSDTTDATQSANYEVHNFTRQQTPVNTFRLVFNYYFGTEFELLQNTTHVFESNEKPYHFTDITELVW